VTASVVALRDTAGLVSPLLVGKAGTENCLRENHFAGPLTLYVWVTLVASAAMIVFVGLAQFEAYAVTNTNDFAGIYSDLGRARDPQCDSHSASCQSAFTQDLELEKEVKPCQLLKSTSARNVR
jgi:hypothetical protein